MLLRRDSPSVKRIPPASALARWDVPPPALPRGKVMSLPRSGCRTLCIACFARVQRVAQVSVDQLAHELISDVAHDLECPGGGGENSLSVYESSWVALVRDPGQPSRLAYPETFTWILDQQRADGGWGPS